MTDLTPWYRQAWPWFLILLPASVVCASFVTLWIAVSRPDPVVRDEYDRNGLEVTRRLAQDASARRLGLSATAGFRPDALLEVRVSPPPATPAPLSLGLVHPTDALQDATLSLEREAEGVYVARAPLPEGRRYLQLEGGEGDDAWRLRGTLVPGAGAVATLLPADEGG